MDNASSFVDGVMLSCGGGGGGDGPESETMHVFRPVR